MANILLIEDDEDFRAFAAAGLRRRGHAVTDVSSGRPVVAESGTPNIGAAFDVVITDIVMPDIDGLEVIRSIKATNPLCKIIAMSAGGRVNGSGLYLHLADALGADSTLRKPFAISELCNAVEESTCAG